MPELAYINGEWMPIEEARVSIDDRGFQFGDGVYEVIRTYNGRLWAIDRHLRRLEHSLQEIDLSGVSIAELKPLVVELFERGQMAEASLYIQVTRGVAPRRHTYDRNGRPTVVMTVRPQHLPDPAIYDQGARAITVPEIRWARRDIKSTNLLANIMAKQRAHEHEAYEAIFVERDGRVNEGSSTNVFIVRGRCVVTRENGPHILPGITRDLVVETARAAGYPLEERPFTRDEMLDADEVFLTGTATELLGLVAVDSRSIAGGRVGEVTRALCAAFRERVRLQQDGETM